MEPIRLRTGRDVRIRQIRPSDAHALKLAYARLSPRSKYQRFLAPKPQLSTADTRYLTEVDGEHHYALVATPADEPELIIGVGRYVRLSDDPRTAEFAIVVGDAFQGEGLATELLERLAAAAREGGVERFTATMLADNRPAHRLMHRLAAGGLVPHDAVAARARESHHHHGPIDEVVVDLAA